MDATPRTPDVFLSLSDAARALSVSTRTLRRLIRAGALVVDGYVGTRPRIRWSQVERYVACKRSDCVPTTWRTPKGKSTQFAVQK